MNKDSHLLFEAYQKALSEKHLHHGEFAKIEKEAEKRYGSKKAGERVAGAVKAKVEAEDAEEHDHELAQRVKKHLHKVFGSDYNEAEASHEAKKIAGVKDEELGHDPNEVTEYDEMQKDISFENYPFWDAYHAVKEGAWTEENFHQWASSVWSDGADHAQSMGSEDCEGVWKDYGKTGHISAEDAESSQDWEKKRYDREQDKWARRKERWGNWKKENPEAAKKHAEDKAAMMGKAK